MSTRPTYPEILARVHADLAAEVGPGSYLRRRLEYGVARAMTGLSHGQYGRMDWLKDQLIPDRADIEQLRRHAGVVGVFEKEPTYAAGPLTVTGSGGDLPAGTTFTRTDGVTYTVDEEHLSVSSESVAVTASAPGLDSDLAAGATVSLISSIPNVDSEATVAAGGITGGFNVETPERLLERYLLRLRNPPRGGATGNYVAWAREVTGVTRAWEYRKVDAAGATAIGMVSVAFVLDDLPDIVPTAGMLTTMQDYLDARAPCEVVAFAPTPAPYSYASAVLPDDPAVRTAVDAEVAAMLLVEASPGGTIYLSSLGEAISIARGETSHAISAPVADKTHAFGELAVFEAGTLT